MTTTPTSRVMADFIAANLVTPTLTLGTNLFDSPPFDIDVVGGVAVFVYAALGDMPTSIKADSSGNQRVIGNERFIVAVRSAPMAGGAAMTIAQGIHDVLNKSTPAGYIDVISSYSAPAYRAVDDNSRFMIEEEFTTQRHYDATATGSGGLDPNAAGGDLGNSFPDPSVIAAHWGGINGTRFTFGALTDGQIVISNGTTVTGSDVSAFSLALLESDDDAEFLSGLGVTTYAQTLLAADDAGEARTVLGLGSAAVLDATVTGEALVEATDAAAARSTLGLGTAATKNVPTSGNAASSEVVLGSDTRLADSRAPTGNAGGNLASTYPNPIVRGVTLSDLTTSLEIGNIPNGALVVRNGSNLEGTTAVVPTARTVTGTAPISVNGVNTAVTLANDLTLAHADSGVTAGQNPPRIGAFRNALTTVDAKGHVTVLKTTETFVDVKYTRTSMFTNSDIFSNSNFSTLGQEAGTSDGIFPVIRVGVSSANSQGVHRWCATSGSDMPLLLSGAYGVITRQVVKIGNIPATGTTVDVFGLTNTFTVSTLPNDGVYWAYDSSRSPNWLCVTAAGGVRTITTTSIPVVDGQWVDLRTETERDRSAARFYMGETLITTHTTNLPATTTGLSIAIGASRTENIAGRNLIYISRTYGATFDILVP